METVSLAAMLQFHADPAFGMEPARLFVTFLDSPSYRCISHASARPSGRVHFFVAPPARFGVAIINDLEKPAVRGIRKDPGQNAGSERG